jgi:hypothetical protein
MAGNMNPTDWTAFYESKKDDGGFVESLFALDDDELADISLSHLDDGGAFTTTIAGSGGTNFIVIPSTIKGKVEVLHQGFASSLHLGGEVILAFIHGNLSGSPFKILSSLAVVEGIGTHRTATRQATRATGGVLSPAPEDYFGVDSEAEFRALSAADCTVLQKRPNHMFFHPKHFIKQNGPKSKSAASFALSIIATLNRRHEKARNPDDATDNVQALVDIEDEKVEVCSLLAFLWAVENGLLNGIDLKELPENPRLNQRCEEIRARIRGGSTPTTATTVPGPTTGAGLTGVDAASLAVSAQALTMAMTRNEQTRLEEREEDRGSKSLFRNLGPKQQNLFLRLATEHMTLEPDMSDFMQGVIKEKSPVKASQLIMAETRRWKGTVSTASLHRFLSNGFISQESNQTEPGGLTGFMFFPRSEVASSVAGANQEKQRVRDYFDLPVEDECVSYYLKKEYYIPNCTHHLQIVMETWRDLIELVTVKRSIATVGLRCFLENLDEVWHMLEEMFRVVPNFGMLVILTFDRHLQNFYDLVSEMDDVLLSSPHARHYLRSRAEDFRNQLEEGKAPTILIPAILHKAIPNSKSEKKAKQDSPSQEKEVQTPCPNAGTHPAWMLPEGKGYGDFFKPKSSGLSGWPKFRDPRWPNSHRGMCLQFQVKGTCKSRCPLSHIQKSSMSASEAADVSTRFKQVYGE